MSGRMSFPCLFHDCAALHTCNIILFEKIRPMQRKTNTTREYVIKFITHLVFCIILFDKFRPMPKKKLIHVIKVAIHLVFGIILFEKIGQSKGHVFSFVHFIKKSHIKSWCRTQLCIYHVVSHVKQLLLTSIVPKNISAQNFPKRSREHIWTLHFLPKLKIIKYSLIITSYEVICGKKTIRSTVHRYLGVPQSTAKAPS